VIPSDVSFLDLSPENLFGELGENRPVWYLHAYLNDEEIGAQSIVVENHYVDRHFLDEFAAYYSRSFDAPESFCGRLHFFTLPRPKIEALFDDVFARGPTKETLENIQSAYRGFVVRRPLEGARMGRTVLRTYEPRGRRYYMAKRRYPVHLLAGC
jgi:hypothetical protein